MKQAIELLQQQIAWREVLLEHLDAHRVLMLRLRIARLDDQLKLLELGRALT